MQNNTSSNNRLPSALFKPSDAFSFKIITNTTTATITTAITTTTTATIKTAITTTTTATTTTTTAGTVYGMKNVY